MPSNGGPRSAAFVPTRFRARLIARLLDCAVRAPNHKLTEPWRFAVLTGAARARAWPTCARATGSSATPIPTSDEARAGAEKVRRETEETPAFVVVMCAVNPDELTREEDYAATMMATANLMIAADVAWARHLPQDRGYHAGPRTWPRWRAWRRGSGSWRVVSLGYPAGEEAPRRRRPAAELTRWIEG